MEQPPAQPSPTVCVITATIGQPNLKKCIESVQRQTYPNVQHLIVVDGPEWNDAVDAILASLNSPARLSIIRLPQPTGKNHYYGHRIYGATPFLVSTDFLTYLDDDNWIDPDHVQAMVAAVTAANAPWGFSLRKIVDEAGQLIALDQCESLGNLHHVFTTDADFSINANCYLIHRDVAVQLAGAWHREGPWAGMQGPGPDRVVCKTLMHYFPGGASSKKHSLNYTVSGKRFSDCSEFFLKGNQAMRDRCPQGLPWEATKS